MKRSTTQQEKEIFAFLNDVRESGAINMFGAAPEIAEHFDMDKNEARKYLSLWMSNFSKDGNYDEITEN